MLLKIDLFVVKNPRIKGSVCGPATILEINPHFKALTRAKKTY